ncbi:MAG: hypothetical protein JWM28_2137, partial [Chitinophagaceae bacterium]|nr:hypothetical protein [Chitinophagaceae bacterium]
YPIGTAKVEYGLTNNLAYYLEGTTNRATTLLIILNVNNPEEKGEGLVYLSKITQKTFQSLHLKMPSELSNSIRSGRVFKADQSDFITTFTLDQSKIETWKVLIKSK